MEQDSPTVTLTPFDEGFVNTSDGYQIHYCLYQSQSQTKENGHETEDNPMEHVIMIPGIATDLEGWKFQIQDLLLCEDRSTNATCCVIDNRGIGESSAPTDKSAYSTKRMALDIVETANTIGWKMFHCVGFSMGGMVACKVASIVPDRLISLALLSVTGGGWEVIPRNCTAIGIAILSACCSRRWFRAYCDIRFHFTPKTLKEKIDQKGTTQFDRLMNEYLSDSVTKQQSSAGLLGQMRACWYHGMSAKEIDSIRKAGFPVLVIHGRHDIVAHPKFGRKLAVKLGGRYIELNGAHMIKRECRHDVSHHLSRILSQNEGKKAF